MAEFSTWPLPATNRPFAAPPPPPPALRHRFHRHLARLTGHRAGVGLASPPRAWGRAPGTQRHRASAVRARSPSPAVGIGSTGSTTPTPQHRRHRASAALPGIAFALRIIASIIDYCAVCRLLHYCIIIAWQLLHTSPGWIDSSSAFNNQRRRHRASGPLLFSGIRVIITGILISYFRSGSGFRSLLINSSSTPHIIIILRYYNIIL